MLVQKNNTHNTYIFNEERKEKEKEKEEVRQGKGESERHINMCNR
jgi:hypothetical protein